MKNYTYALFFEKGNPFYRWTLKNWEEQFSGSEWKTEVRLLCVMKIGTLIF